MMHETCKNRPLEEQCYPCLYETAKAMQAKIKRLEQELLNAQDCTKTFHAAAKVEIDELWGELGRLYMAIENHRFESYGRKTAGCDVVASPTDDRLYVKAALAATPLESNMGCPVAPADKMTGER